jgi:hypothetical protein
MYNEENVDALNEKIHKKFIRNVIKPMEQYYGHQSYQSPYKIPSSSSFLSPIKAFNPEEYEKVPKEEKTPIYLSSTYSTPCPTPAPLNCIVVCEHIQSCPVCSQLYKPYTGVYLTVITILVIIILFLLKKIFQF